MAARHAGRTKQPDGGVTKAFSSEVEPGSPYENASK
jgi:hypothetical protein